MSYIIENAIELRKLVEQELVQLVPKDTAIQYAHLHPKWNPDAIAYTTGFRVTYNGVLYEVISGHISQSKWKPSQTPSLFEPIGPYINQLDDVPTDWDLTNRVIGYSAGEECIHNGKIWRSTSNNNTTEPETNEALGLWDQIDN